MSDWRERTRRLIGGDATERLAAVNVAVVGLGGVGGYIAEALARAGIGGLALIDSDVFAESNLNRQIGCLVTTLGMPKSAVTAQRARLINPSIKAVSIAERLGGESAQAWEAISKCDYVADAIDDVGAKALLAVFCADNGIAEISCMGTGNRMGTRPFEIADIYATSGDPLARALRPRLRKAGIKSLDVCWTREEPNAAEKSGTLASISYVPAMAGLTAAGHIIRRICGVKP